MNILLIHQYFLEENDGGGSRFNAMTKRWTDQNHSVTVLAGMMHANALTKRPEYVRKYFFRKQHGAVKVLRCHTSVHYNANFIGRLWGYFSFVLSSTIAGIFRLRKEKFDLILVTSPPLFVGITGMVLSWFRRIPLVFEVRDLWPESAVDAGVIRNKLLIRLAFFLEKWIYRYAAIINVLTPAFKKKLIEKKKVPANKIIEIPNGADLSDVEMVLDQFDRTAFRMAHQWEGRLVLVYVGAHGVANHLQQVIEAAESVKDSIPHLLFVLIGDGMEKQRLMVEVQHRKLENVRFMDPVSKENVYQFIAGADFGMSILKKAEAFKTVYSNKTFDYMACRTPVLMLIDGISRRLVEEARCGFYAEPENTYMLVQTLQHMNDLSREEIGQMGKSGYDFVSKYFNRDILSDRYLEKLAQLQDEG